MKTLLQHPDHRGPLGLLALALAGLLLLGFHQVVNGAMQRAELQRAQVHQLAEHEASCLSLKELAQRELCALRAEQALAGPVAAAASDDVEAR